MHFDLFCVQELLLLLNVSTLQRPVLHLAVSILLYCYTTGPKLHLDVSPLQMTVLFLDVSNLNNRV
jgi:hypothetical protein